MADITQTKDLFFTRTGMSESRVEALVGDALAKADDGELFLEYRQSEGILFDDGRVKSASFDTAQGFGLRGVFGEASGYAHASEISEQAVARAAETVTAVGKGQGAGLAPLPASPNRQLYSDINPLSEMAFEDKVSLLQEIDAYARSKDPRVRQVTASMAASWQAVQIVRGDGSAAADIRPLVRLNVNIVAEQDGRMETGSHGVGGRDGYAQWVDSHSWKSQVDEAYRQAIVNLDSVPAPAGEMTVVLGPGWPGILLHEAIGHGLEGDFNRKGTSAFSDLLGQRVAAPGVTVIDDGTINERRGSLTIDDEGTPTSRTVLIEDGILTGYIHDRLNARLMGHAPTGNGRRESYAHNPIPRMTNTFMLGGNEDPDEIVAAAKSGIYAVNFGGGQVDITSGKFVFTCTEAYLIEDGKIGAPVKGATLIGSGPEALKKVRMIGNDMTLDPGVGTCGKDGQGVPVGVGQPTMLIDELTVGGTAV
jgi:TldD protein